MKYKYDKRIDICGKQYRIRANSLKELTQKIEAKTKSVEKTSLVVSGNTTLSKWAEMCVETYKVRQKESTRKVYVRRMQHCILDHIGMMRLQDITPMHCQQVLNLQIGNSKTQINEVYQALRFLFKHALANKLVSADTPKDEYIACFSTGSMIEEDHRARLWKSYTRQLNFFMGCKTYRNALVPPYPLAPELVPYCLRHEFCTELARKKIDIRIAQKLMGHSDIQLTANIYTNYNNEEDIIDIAELLCGSVS